jgi:hypothetical protein
MTKRGCRMQSWLVPVLLGVLVMGSALVGPQQVSAAVSGPTVEGDICMQRIFMGPDATVTNSNKLNCTANDIRISRALSVTPNTCTASGDPNNPSFFDLVATFETIVTANARYDAGFFFRTDGGGSARGTGPDATGTCSLSWLTNGVSPALNIDGDTCGDLNAGTYSLTFEILHVACVDTDNDGFVNLPNCTSWHSNQGTACTAPADADDAHVFDFHPDTKSKCVCDDTFNIPVTVETANGKVRKTATQAVVTYQVQVSNTSTSRTIQILSLNDDIYGDLTKDKTTGNLAIQSTTCGTLINDTVGPSSASDTCTFTVLVSNTDTTGDGSTGTVNDTVTAHVKDTGNNAEFDFTGSTTITVDLGPDNSAL